MDPDPRAMEPLESPSDEMSLDDFVVYARGLQTESCPRCGVQEAAQDGGKCAGCATPTLGDRLGPIGKLWRSIAYRLGLA